MIIILLQVSSTGTELLQADLSKPLGAFQGDPFYELIT